MVRRFSQEIIRTACVRLTRMRSDLKLNLGPVFLVNLKKPFFKAEARPGRSTP